MTELQNWGFGFKQQSLYYMTHQFVKLDRDIDEILSGCVITCT
jgi:hypothetical protein